MEKTKWPILSVPLPSACCAAGLSPTACACPTPRGGWPWAARPEAKTSASPAPASSGHGWGSRAKSALLFGERVLRAAEGQPDRHRIETQFAADAVDEIAPVGFGKLIEPGAEQDEAGRAGFRLGDVAQLDPPSARRGRRVCSQRIVEPAVERSRGHALRPGIAD